MTGGVNDLLASFDKLPPTDQYEVALEILRRTSIQLQGDPEDDALTQLADDLFRELDAEENRHAPSWPRQ